MLRGLPDDRARMSAEILGAGVAVALVGFVCAIAGSLLARLLWPFEHYHGACRECGTAGPPVADPAQAARFLCAICSSREALGEQRHGSSLAGAPRCERFYDTTTGLTVKVASIERAKPRLIHEDD